MTSPRQKLRHDNEAPILFSLPNLRTRGSRPTSQPSCEVAVPTANHTLRVDPPVATAMPAVIPAEADFQPVVHEVQMVTPEVKPPVADARPVYVAAPPQLSAASPSSRSWMERVGSRLILVVTLMVIVTAAWITGRRMPATKSDPWNESPSVEHDVAAASQGTPATTPAATPAGVTARQLLSTPSLPTATAVVALPATPAPPAQSSLPTTSMPSAFADSYGLAEQVAPAYPAWPGTAQVAVTELPTAEFNAPASADQRTPASDSLQVAASTPLASTPLASSPSTPATPAESLPVFNTVSMQSSASTPDAKATSTTAESLSLDPPLPATPATPATPAIDTSAAKAAVGNATAGVQTSTPHAPVVDPKVLLPWFHEQVAARNHRKSTTPNAISDWARYLPGASSGDQNVRAASSNETSGAPIRAQQAAVPHGLITNPYSQ